MLSIGNSKGPTKYTIKCRACGWKETGVKEPGQFTLGTDPCPKCKTKGKLDISFGSQPFSYL